MASPEADDAGLADAFRSPSELIPRCSTRGWLMPWPPPPSAAGPGQGHPCCPWRPVPKPVGSWTAKDKPSHRGMIGWPWPARQR